MLNSVISFRNGKHSNGVVLPSKRKTREEDGKDGDITEDIKGIVKRYVDQKLKLRESMPSTRVIRTSSDGEDIESPYPEVPEIPNTYETFFLGHGGLAAGKRERAIAVARRYHETQKSNFMGYQVNFHLDYEKDFPGYLDIHLNNIGDPFKEGNLTVNSKFMERAVLDYYAELWNAKWPYNDKDKESYWGFCLTMGSTEGNLYGMWNGRDYLGGKKILIDEQLVMRSGVMVSSPRFVYQKAVLPADSPNAYTPIAFFSEDTHYSISKAMTMLSIQTFYAEGEEKYPGECPLNNGTWPAEVPSHESGAMNIDSLSVLVEFFASRGYPIIVCFNYGTTFKGAYDDVSYACRKLKPILEKYNLLERDVTYGDNQTDKRTGFWFHVDGALGAAYMPFIEMAYLSSRVATKGPTFDFRLPMVHSIAMSGHKWIGAPVPCGVFMTRVKYQMLPPEIPEYIGSPDTTFAGSRNGLSPMLLWDNIARHSYEDQIQKALDLEQLAAYAEDKLLYLQNEVLHTDLFVARTKLALTVRFKRANEKLCRKYSLSNEDLGGRRFSHIFLMEHVTTELVDQLIEDLSLEDAFAPQEDVMTFTVDPSVRASTKNRVAFVPSEGRGFHG